MMKLLLLSILSSICLTKLARSQSPDPFIQSVVDLVSYDSLQSDLQELENFGRKEIFDTALAYTGEWLIQSYQNMGYNDIQTDYFEFSGQQIFNVVVTKPGTEFPDQYLIIDGHYDTQNGPGVNDNGSGVAIILEIARLVQNIPTRYSLRFINFTAEEYGLVGSYHYVQEVVIPQDMNIRLVFNIDEVGGVAGLPNDTIICERDESSPTANNAESWAFTDTLAALTGIYSGLESTISYAYGSDYVPFQNNGEIITGLYEFNNSPYPHTIHDSLANLDMNYVYEIAKLSVAATLYFSYAFDTTTGTTQKSETDKTVEIYPNPFSDFLFVRAPFEFSGFSLVLCDETGNIINYSQNVTSGEYKIPAKSFAPGFYSYKITDRLGYPIKQGKLVKIRY
jgi:hypothetical protein